MKGHQHQVTVATNNDLDLDGMDSSPQSSRANGHKLIWQPDAHVLVRTHIFGAVQ